MILAIKLAFAALVAIAAIQDMRELKIANRLSIALIALFPFWVYAVGFETAIWQNVLLCIVVFVAGTLLFALGWLGGGDVKLLAAVALWFDFGGAAPLLFSIALGGGVLVVILAIMRRALPVGWRERTGWKVFESRGPIPYGVAIALGAVLCSASPGFSPRPLSSTDIVMSLKGWQIR